MLKIKKYLKKNLILLISVLVLCFFNSLPIKAQTIDIYWPIDGATNVSVGCYMPPEAGGDPAWDGDGDGEGEGQECYFKWQEIPGTVKYVLDTSISTQSEDNITPSTSKTCLPEAGGPPICSGGICEFPFCRLTIGEINYLMSYTWKVTAHNLAGEPIATSNEVGFSTEQNPEATPPPPPPDGDDDDGGPEGPGGPGGIILPRPANPLKAETFWEALDLTMGNLILLALAVGSILITYAASLLILEHDKAIAVNKAKTIVLWVVISMIIIALAKAIPATVKGLL
jgi:hypothetical protein